MRIRSLLATAACISSLMLVQLTPVSADGMSDEDENFNPVPSKPAVRPADVKQPAPIKSSKPASKPTPAKPAPTAVATPPAVTAPVASAPTSPATETPKLAPVVEAPKPPASTTPPPAVTPPAATAPPATANPPAVSTPPATVTPPATAAPQPVVPNVPKKNLYLVLTVTVAVQEKYPLGAVITVKGTARTGGWTDIELKPLPTTDGIKTIRSFALMGVPPKGPATQALTPVTATYQLDPLPPEVKTIKVVGEDNYVSQSFR